MNRKKVADLLVIGGAGLWGCMGLFVRGMNAMGLSTMQIMFFRTTLAVILFGVVLFFFDRKSLQIELRHLWYFFGSGVLSFFVFGYAYFKTITLTSMSIAATLLYTSPIFVMLMSILFFRERVTPAKLLSIVAAFVGCWLVAGKTDGTQLTAEGLLTGLLSGFCYALYSIFGQVALKKYSSNTVTFYTFLFAAFACLFAVDFKGIGQIAGTSPSLWLYAIGIAVVVTLMPYWLYTTGLADTGASKAAVISTVEPVVATLLGLLVFGEEISIRSFLGIACVILAIVLIQSQKKA